VDPDSSAVYSVFRHTMGKKDKEKKKGKGAAKTAEKTEKKHKTKTKKELAAKGKTIPVRYLPVPVPVPSLLQYLGVIFLLLTHPDIIDAVPPTSNRMDLWTYVLKESVSQDF